MTTPAGATGPDERTGWVGWIAFAAVMMIIGGSLNAFYGLIAIVNKTWVGWVSVNSTYLTIQSWGWLHLLLGILVVACGFGVLTGNLFARTIGVFLAGISLIGNFFFIPVYPLWAIIVIVIDVLVIWALTAHGREMKQDY